MSAPPNPSAPYYAGPGNPQWNKYPPVPLAACPMGIVHCETSGDLSFRALHGGPAGHPILGGRRVQPLPFWGHCAKLALLLVIVLLLVVVFGGGIVRGRGR